MMRYDNEQRKNCSRGQKGVMIVLFAVVLPFLIAAMGLAVDFGNAYVRKSQLQNAADAAALAGGRVYADALKAGTADPKAAADSIAASYVTKNDKNVSAAPVLEIHSSASSSTTLYYRVMLSDTVGTYFLRYFGYASIPVNAICTVKLSAKPGGNPFSLFNNLITFQDSLRLVNEKKKTWDGDIVHTMPNPSITINGGGPLDRSDGTTFDPASSQFYNSNLSVDLNNSLNAKLKSYITGLMTTQNSKTLKGQSMDASDLSSTVTYINGRVSSLQLDAAIGDKNTTKILILTEGAANVHVKADTVGTLVIFDLSNEQIHIEGKGTLRSIVYAPNSSIMMNPNGLKFYGNLTSKSVDIQASTGTFSTDPNTPSLPNAPGSQNYTVDLTANDDSDIL